MIARWDLQLERPINWPWGWAYLNPKQRRASEDASAEEESKCMAEEASGEGEKSASEVTGDGYFLLGLVLLGDSLQRRRWLDRIGLIVSAGSSGFYRLDRIGISLGFSRRNWILCAGWFANVWMRHMDWMGQGWSWGGINNMM